MALLDVEIDRFDWPGLECGCGIRGAHLVQDLRALASADTYEEAQALGLSDHVLIQSFPQEPAFAVTSVLMAMLAGDTSLGAKAVVLDLLLRLIDSDDEDSSEVCREIVRDGIWLLYAEMLASRAKGIVSDIFLILRQVERVPSRLEEVKASGDIELPEYLL